MCFNVRSRRMQHAPSLPSMEAQLPGHPAALCEQALWHRLCDAAKTLPRFPLLVQVAASYAFHTHTHSKLVIKLWLSQ